MKHLETLLKSASAHPLISPSISFESYVFIDLSVNSLNLKTEDIATSQSFTNYMNAYLKSNNAKVAYGGYLEKRNIYNRSSYFNNAKTERNIHLGLDVWIAAKTPIYTPLKGEVHSFKNNTNYGDYGPTIILKHDIQNTTFYTLYGHLSLESIEKIEVGQVFKKGEQIATLGDATVNGDYPPHLHFQIIQDVENYVGDYPGVCSQADLEFYTKNCPNPEWLLDFKNTTI